MFETTAAINSTKSQQPQSGAARSAAGGPTAKDFAALFTSHAYAALANAQSVQESQLPDYARTTSFESEASIEQAPDANYPPPSARPSDEPRPEPAQQDPAKYDTDDQTRGSTYSDDAALPALTDASSSRSGNAPLPQGAERSAASTTQAGSASPSSPDAAPQQSRSPDDAAAQMLKAQIVDSTAKDRLPQLRHTLSSGTALVAQSGGKAALAGDNAVTGAGGNSASSIAAGAAQAAAQAGQKAKAQTSAPNAVAGGAAQNTGASPATLHSVPAVAAGNGQLWQQGSNQSSLMNGGAAKSTPLASGLARADALAPGGDGSAGFQVPIRPAAQSAPQKPLPPMPPRLIANQVAVQIQKGLSQGGDRISIQLKPAELGRVDVRLDMVGDGRVAAVVTADRADTLDLLQRDARLLQNALQDAGLETDGNSLSFELKGQNGGQSGSSDESTAGTTDTEDDQLNPPHSFDARPSIVSDDRIDVHI